MGKDTHTHTKARDGGPGGLRVGSPYFPILTYTQERARCKRTAGETPNPTTQKQEKGEENTRQGEPHQPREKRKVPLDAEEERQNTDEIAWGKHLDVVAELEEARAQRRARAPVVDRKQTKITEKQNSHLLPSVSPPDPRRPKKTVVVTMRPHPGTPNREDKEPLQGRNLKGN